MTRKYILSFSKECTNRPLTYELIKDYDIRVNILRGEIQAGETGTLLVEMEQTAEQIAEGIAFLRSNGVKVDPVVDRITYDEKRCIHCGNCALACFSQALTIGAPDWYLHFNPEKCVLCKICLTSCPLQLFQIDFD